MMRKEYHQPKLYAERFVMMEHIASNCKVDTSVDTEVEGPQNFNSSTSNGCYYGLNDGDWKVFGSGNNACGKPKYADNWSDVDLMCYDAFQDGTGSMFGS